MNEFAKELLVDRFDPFKMQAKERIGSYRFDKNRTFEYGVQIGGIGFPLVS
jgi:hypothetical protein